MAKKVEFYKGRPVFQANNSKELAAVVAEYEGEVKPPYVVRIKKNTKYIADLAFSDDDNVGVVFLPDSVVRIGEVAFSCRNLSEICIPDSVVEIGEGSFYECESLTRICIPDSVRFIGEQAFGECPNLMEIRINNRRLLEDTEYPYKAKVMSLNGVTLAYFIEELRRFAAKYPDWKVACKLDDGTYYYINDMDEYEDDLDAIVLCRYEDAVSDFYTVSDFLETDPEAFSASEVIIKHFFNHVVDDDLVYHCQIFHTIAELKTGIFFKAMDGEEEVIAFRPGFVYDIGDDDE